jgi:hypothetical protein
MGMTGLEEILATDIEDDSFPIPADYSKLRIE